MDLFKYISSFNFYIQITFFICYSDYVFLPLSLVYFAMYHNVLFSIWKKIDFHYQEGWFLKQYQTFIYIINCLYAKTKNAESNSTNSNFHLTVTVKNPDCTWELLLNPVNDLWDISTPSNIQKNSLILKRVQQLKMNSQQLLLLECNN